MRQIQKLGCYREAAAVNETLQRFSFRIGDEVCVKGWPPSSPMVVTDTSDQSLLTLELPSSYQVRVGRAAVMLIGNGSNTD